LNRMELVTLSAALVFLACRQGNADDRLSALEKELFDAHNRKDGVNAVHIANPIDAQSLESVNWYFNPYFICDSYFVITFDKGCYLASELHNGAYSIGEYSIISPNTIRLLPFSTQKVDYQDERLPFTDGSENLAFAVDSQDFWYSSKLTGVKTGSVFYATQSKSPPNKQYRIDGIKVTKINETLYQSATNLKVRSLPSQKGGELTILKAGTVVNAYAIGPREKIDGIESNWFYVDFAYEDQYCTVFGWVFGGYLYQKK
jgi:hypothetical protein